MKFDQVIIPLISYNISKTEGRNQILITITKLFCIYFHQVAGALKKADKIIQMITLTVITISDARCISFLFVNPFSILKFSLSLMLLVDDL